MNNRDNAKLHRPNFLVLLLLLTGLAMAPCLADASGGGPASTAWPMFQHDQGHTGRSPYLGTQTNVLRWSYDTDSQFRGSAAIGSDGTIYINSYNSSCKLYAFNPDGSVKWASPTDSVDGSPAISSDGTIYVASAWGLYAYNPDGTRKWFCSALSLNGSPVIGNDGTIYCGQSGSGGAGLLYAFSDHGSSGSVKWTYNTGQLLHTAPAIGNDGTIYIGSIYNTLFALTDKGASADLKWTFTAACSLRSSPPSIGSDGTIYIGSDWGYVYAITDSGNKAVQKWRFDTAGSVVSAPAIGNDGTIYVGCQSGPHILFALNPDGSPKWDYGSGDIASSSAAIGNDGTIYIGDVYGKVYAVFDDTVRRIAVLKWEYTAGDSIYGSAAIGSDGTVYIGSYDSKFYAFNDRPLVTAVNPNSGTQGQTINNVIITGCQFTGATAVSFGAGITVNSFNTDNATQITANITIAPGAILGTRDVLVTTPEGTGTKTGCFTVNLAPTPIPTLPNPLIGTGAPTSHGASVSGPISPAPPVSLPSLVIQSASLSAKAVTPGTPIIVTADIANKSAVNGNKKVTLYINGQVETTQGITVNSGGSTKLTFHVSRSEPGDYTVYVDGVPAGSFKVEMVTGPDSILIFSAILVALAFIVGMVMLWRRQRAV